MRRTGAPAVEVPEALMAGRALGPVEQIWSRSAPKQTPSCAGDGAAEDRPDSAAGPPLMLLPPLAVAGEGGVGDVEGADDLEMATATGRRRPGEVEGLRWPQPDVGAALGDCSGSRGLDDQVSIQLVIDEPRRPRVRL